MVGWIEGPLCGLILIEGPLSYTYGVVVSLQMSQWNRSIERNEIKMANDWLKQACRHQPSESRNDWKN